jgi:hypothetical protein
MRFNLFKHCCLISFASLLLFSCSGKTEQLETDLLTDYIQLQPGKYITYRVDSMVFTNFGRTTEIHKYQEKHVIDALVMDNENRPSYRVFRYLRDSAGTQAWTNNGSYFITVLDDQVEVIEDNLRVIKLHMPVKEGFRWQGNKYLPDDPYGSIYTFSTDDFMRDWDFSFSSLNTETIGQTNIPDVRTVEYSIFEPSVNVLNNMPIVNTNYAYNTYCQEKYAKNIGLVYKELILWEHQPNSSGSGGPYKTGFGVTMWMIDHN